SFEVREPFAGAPDGCGGDRTNADHRATVRALHPGCDLRRVVHRRRVRHRANCSETARGGSGRAGRGRFLVALCVPAGMYMKVDESWSDEQTSRLQHCLSAFGNLAYVVDCSDLSTFNQQIATTHLACSGDQSAAGDQQRASTCGVVLASQARPPSARSRMALRTATPLRTCSSTSERALSATSLVSSIPRTIGPGCITNASSGASAMRCEVNW